MEICKCSNIFIHSKHITAGVSLMVQNSFIEPFSSQCSLLIPLRKGFLIFQRGSEGNIRKKSVNQCFEMFSIHILGKLPLCKAFVSNLVLVEPNGFLVLLLNVQMRLIPIKEVCRKDIEQTTIDKYTDLMLL